MMMMMPVGQHCKCGHACFSVCLSWGLPSMDPWLMQHYGRRLAARRYFPWYVPAWITEWR